MTRLLPPPDRDALDPSERDRHDRVASRFGVAGAGGYFGALLHSPPVADAINALSMTFRGAADAPLIDARRREWVDIVVARHLGSNWMMRAHLQPSLDAGIELAAIRAYWSGDEDGLGDDGPLVAFVTGVVTGAVTDDGFAWLVELAGERGAVEYTAFVCWVMMNTRLIQGLGVEEISAADLETAFAAQA